MGAPLKLEDAKLRNALLANIRKGTRLRNACEVAGVDYSTFRRWLRDGEPPEDTDLDPLTQGRPRGRGPAADKAKREFDTLSLKRDFYHAVENVEAVFRTALDLKIRNAAGKEGFNALVRYAKYRFPDDYREPATSPVVQVNASTQGGDVTMTFAEIAANAVADEGDGDDVLVPV